MAPKIFHVVDRPNARGERMVRKSRMFLATEVGLAPHSSCLEQSKINSEYNRGSLDSHFSLKK